MADGSDSPVKGRKSRKVEHSRVAPPLPPSFVLLKGIASLTGVKSTFPTGLPGFAIDKYFVVVFLSSFNPHFSRPVHFPFVPRSFPSFSSLILILAAFCSESRSRYYYPLPSASTWTNSLSHSHSLSFSLLSWPSGVPPTVLPTLSQPRMSERREGAPEHNR